MNAIKERKFKHKRKKCSKVFNENDDVIVISDDESDNSNGEDSNTIEKYLNSSMSKSCPGELLSVTENVHKNKIFFNTLGLQYSPDKENIPRTSSNDFDISKVSYALGRKEPDEFFVNYHKEKKAPYDLIKLIRQVGRRTEDRPYSMFEENVIIEQRLRPRLHRESQNHDSRNYSRILKTNQIGKLRQNKISRSHSSILKPKQANNIPKNRFNKSKQKRKKRITEPIEHEYNEEETKKSEEILINTSISKTKDSLNQKIFFKENKACGSDIHNLKPSKKAGICTEKIVSNTYSLDKTKVEDDFDDTEDDVPLSDLKKLLHSRRYRKTKKDEKLKLKTNLNKGCGSDKESRESSENNCIKGKTTANFYTLDKPEIDKTTEESIILKSCKKPFQLKTTYKTKHKYKKSKKKKKERREYESDKTALELSENMSSQGETTENFDCYKTKLDNLITQKNTLHSEINCGTKKKYKSDKEKNKNKEEYNSDKRENTCTKENTTANLYNLDNRKVDQSLHDNNSEENMTFSYKMSLQSDIKNNETSLQLPDSKKTLASEENRSKTEMKLKLMRVHISEKENKESSKGIYCIKQETPTNVLESNIKSSEQTNINSMCSRDNKNDTIIINLEKSLQSPDSKTNFFRNENRKRTKMKLELIREQVCKKGNIKSGDICQTQESTTKENFDKTGNKINSISEISLESVTEKIDLSGGDNFDAKNTHVLSDEQFFEDSIKVVDSKFSMQLSRNIFMNTAVKKESNIDIIVTSDSASDYNSAEYWNIGNVQNDLQTNMLMSNKILTKKTDRHLVDSTNPKSKYLDIIRQNQNELKGTQNLNKYDFIEINTISKHPENNYSLPRRSKSIGVGFKFTGNQNSNENMHAQYSFKNHNLVNSDNLKETEAHAEKKSLETLKVKNEKRNKNESHSPMTDTKQDSYGTNYSDILISADMFAPLHIDIREDNEYGTFESADNFINNECNIQNAQLENEKMNKNLLMLVTDQRDHDCSGTAGNKTCEEYSLRSLSSFLNYDIIRGLAKHPSHHWLCQCMTSDDYLNPSELYEARPEIENLSLLMIYRPINVFIRTSLKSDTVVKVYEDSICNRDLFSFAKCLTYCEIMKTRIEYIHNILVFLLKTSLIKSENQYSASKYFSYIINDIEGKEEISFLSSLDLWLILLKIMGPKEDFYESVPIFRKLLDFVYSLCPWQLWKRDILRIQRKISKSGILTSEQDDIFKIQIQNYLSIPFKEVMQFPTVLSLNETTSKENVNNPMPPDVGTPTSTPNFASRSNKSNLQNYHLIADKDPDYNTTLARQLPKNYSYFSQQDFNNSLCPPANTMIPYYSDNIFYPVFNIHDTCNTCHLMQMNLCKYPPLPNYMMVPNYNNFYVTPLPLAHLNNYNLHFR